MTGTAESMKSIILLYVLAHWLQIVLINPLHTYIIRFNEFFLFSPTNHLTIPGHMWMLRKEMSLS